MEGKPVNWRDYITVDPEICHGRACITGTRVLVTTRALHGRFNIYNDLRLFLTKNLPP